jgi:hypothetical protein
MHKNKKDFNNTVQDSPTSEGLSCTCNFEENLRTVYVSNVSSKASENEIKEFFSNIG